MGFFAIERSVKNSKWSMNLLHSHTHYEIYFLVKGERTLLLSNALYRLKAPAIIIIPPQVSHKTEGGQFERYNVNADAGYLDAFQKDTLDSLALEVLTPTEAEAEEIEALLKKAAELEESRYREHIQRAIFSYAVLLLSRLDSHRRPTAKESASLPPLVLKVIDYFNTNYSNRISLDSVAEEFFVSKGTLIYNFDKHLGISPMDYLLGIRISRAKHLLSNTTDSIGKVARACGFSSANYFGLIFKRKTGLSPTAYRRYESDKL